MDVPSSARTEWFDLVTGKQTFQLSFFAAKILLGRLLASAAGDPSPGNVEACVNQIRELYLKNAGSASAQQDLQAIFGTGSKRQGLMSAVEAADLIASGNVLFLAGEEDVLQSLPKGTWIGGTIPYFICCEQGGQVSREKVFVTDISDMVRQARIAEYDADALAKVYSDGPDNGFSFIIIPAMSKAHLSFALNAPHYPDFGAMPLIGWISGVHLDDLEKRQPKVINGRTGAEITDGALVLHVDLPDGKMAEAGIINLFEQGDGDTLTFETDGFAATEVLVNGEKKNFATYLLKNNIDTKLPLVADYYGVLVNISFQGFDEAGGGVKFYAPVFRGIPYKLAKPVSDYGVAFKSRLESQRHPGQERVVFSCNCILNYLYSHLEGETTKPFAGPVTFGEIAYQLLNQTLVYLEVRDA